jgi:hypothetical protein
MSTTHKTEELELSQAEVACLALALQYEWPLLLDGEAGLLHVSMDIDGAKSRLAEAGALDGTSPHPRPLGDHFAVKVLSLLDQAPLRVHLVANRSGLRRTAFLASNASDAAAIAPLRFESVDSFRLSLFGPASLEAEASAWLGGFPPSGQANDRTECGHSLPTESLVAVLAAVRRGEVTVAREVLARCGWDSPCGEQFVLDALSDPAGYTCRVLRHRGTTITVDELSWNCTERGGWWEWELDRDLDAVRFTTTSAVSLEHRVAQLLGDHP